MTNIEEVIDVLFDFVKRASSKEATPEEVQTLPEVARVMLETLRD